MTDSYKDIIDTKWPRPSYRTKMPLGQRAKIFLPFAALTGFENLIKKYRQDTEDSYVTHAAFCFDNDGNIIYNK